MKKLIFRSSIVSFYDLSPEWRAEARRNLDDEAEMALYLQPLESHVPKIHILWDICNFFPSKDDGFYAVYPVSNGCAVGLRAIDNSEEVELWSL